MKNISRIASPLLTLLLLASPAYAADASSDQDVATLKAEIAKLSQKVDQLQAQTKKTAAAQQATAAAVAAAPAPAPALVATAADVVTKGTMPGSFKVPGTDTSVKIGGYIKLDAIADGEGYGASFAHFYAIPLKTAASTQQGEQTTFGAQQSRVNLATSTPTSYGEVKTFIEGDFYGAAGSNGNTNGYGFELRHAYGSIGSAPTGMLLAGQTWSTFMDADARPESMDYVGPAGEIFVRQPQVRYTHDVGPVTVSASVESPIDVASQSTPNAVTTTNGTTATTHGMMPDLIARGDYHYASDGYVSLRALANQVNVDRTTAGNNDTETKYGYGLGLSGKQVVVAKDNVNYNLELGNGTGRYVYDINATGNYFNPNTGVLKTQPYYGGTLGYQHYWSEQFRSNLFGGGVRLVNDTSFIGANAGTVNKYIASGHANIIWQPAPAYQVGLEYMHGYRKVESGVEGNLDRTEASFIYNF